jgi:hypothetical protein
VLGAFDSVGGLLASAVPLPYRLVAFTEGGVELDGSSRDYWGKAADFDNALDIFPKTK